MVACVWYEIAKKIPVSLQLHRDTGEDFGSLYLKLICIHFP